jgi:tetrahydromethanopterin S-methyltransferase subunit D
LSIIFLLGEASATQSIKQTNLLVISISKTVFEMLKMDVMMLVGRLDGSFGSRKKPTILNTYEIERKTWQF